MEAVRWILAYARPTFVCNWRDLCRINRLAEICVWLLRALAIQFVQDHSDDPLLIQYGADATPLVIRHRYASSWRHLSVGRSGRSVGEWLVQRCFLVAADGARTVLFCEPKLLADKTAWSHFQAFRRLLPLGRELGHSGLILQHFVYDRAVSSAMTRHVRQLLEARRVFEEGFMPEGRAHLSSLLSWCTSVACVNHDAHNALRWGLLSFYDSKDNLRSLYICIEALRQSVDELVRHAPGWVARRLRFEAAASPEVLRSLWTMVGFAGDWVDHFVELELRFDDGHLKVHPRWEADAQLPDMIMNAILFAWQWKKFSESRWMSLGASCQSLLGSLLLGLQDLVGEVLLQPGVCTYYLKGFSFLSSDALGLCALASISSFLADTILAKLLEDARVPMIYDELMQEMRWEVDYVVNLDPEVLECIARVAGMSRGRLQEEACMSVLIQAGFFKNRIRAAERPPFSILKKDPAEALDDLVESPCPAEENLAKLWKLLKLGYSRVELEKGLRLLSQAGWSSAPVEQAHAAASMLMKKHSDYGQRTLASRSMLVSMAPLVKPSASEAKIKSVEAKLEALARRRPQHIRGRQVFLRELNMRAGDLRSEGKAVAPNMHERLMQQHGKMWQDFGEEARWHYEVKAGDARDRAVEKLHEQRLELEAELRLLRDRTQQEEASGYHMLLSSCRLGRNQLTELQAQFAGKDWPAKRVDALRVAASEPIGPPPEAERQVLDAMELEDGVAPTAPPTWLALLCHHRATFQTCAVRFRAGSAWAYYKFIFAMQNPRLVCFLKVAPVEAGKALIDPCDFDRFAMSEWEHTLMYEDLVFAYSDGSDIRAEWPMEVLMDVCCKGGALFRRRRLVVTLARG